MSEQTCQLDEMRFLSLRRVEQEVRHVGQQHGFDGDPLAERVPQFATLSEIECMNQLFGQLSFEVRKNTRSLAIRMISAMILTSTGRQL